MVEEVAEVREGVMVEEVIEKVLQTVEMMVEMMAEGTMEVMVKKMGW